MLSIRRIKLKNFRQYKDVDLSFPSETGIYLFIGKTGMGKSNFLNAICWCLYDKQPFKFYGEDDAPRTLLNQDAASQNRFDEVKVSIEVSMDDKIFLFQRTKRESQDSHLTVMIKRGENWDPVDNPTVIINSFLPEQVSRFFLFDGEAVQNLYKGNYAQNLKEGVWSVSEVTLLDRASEHLDKTRDAVQLRIGKGDPDTATLAHEIEELKKQYHEFVDLQKEKEVSIKTLKDRKEKLNDEFKKYEKYKDIRERKQQLENDKQDIETRLKDYQKQIDDLIVSYVPFWYNKELLLKFAQKINDASTKGKLPPKIQSEFIDELIDKGVCICGTSLSKDSECYKILLKTKADVSSTSEFTNLLDDKFRVNSLLKDLGDEFPNKIKDVRMRKSQEHLKEQEIEIKLREIKEKLQNAPDAAVGDIALTMKKIDDDIEEFMQKIGELNVRIQQTDKLIKDKNEEFNKISEKLDKMNLNKNKLLQLEEAKDKIDYVRQRLVDQVRKSVSNFTDQYFKELIWKKGEYESIKFTENYDVEVYKIGEQISNLKILSTGEMKSLSFATIKALGKLSGFSNVPLFIDGPLENLDNEVQENFLNLLPSFVENKQAFIFSLDRDVILQYGKKQINQVNFYKLTRPEGSKSTIIQNFK